MNILDFVAFEDHNEYSLNDLRILRTRFRNIAFKYIITTEKDWVKLPEKELDESWIAPIQRQLDSTDVDVVRQALAVGS